MDGLYSTTIGDNTVYGSMIDALTNAAVYLELTVNGATLSPRERLVSVPYALNYKNSTLNITQEALDALDARYVLLTGSNITSLAAYSQWTNSTIDLATSFGGLNTGLTATVVYTTGGTSTGTVKVVYSGMSFDRPKFGSASVGMSFTNNEWRFRVGSFYATNKITTFLPVTNGGWACSPSTGSVISITITLPDTGSLQNQVSALQYETVRSYYFDSLLGKLSRENTPTSDIVYVSFVNDDRSTNAILDTLFSSQGVPYCPAVIGSLETSNSLAVCKTYQDLYGFEYLSHAWTEPGFDRISLVTMEEQCSRSYSNMVAAGLNVESIIYPGGYKPVATNIAPLKRYYKSGSGVVGSEINTVPIESYEIRRRSIDNMTLLQMQTGISNAIAYTNKLFWHVDFLHSYMYETNGAYYTVLSNYVAWIKTLPNVQIVTYSTALKKMGYFFENGDTISTGTHYGVTMQGTEVKTLTKAPYYGLGTMYADGENVYYIPSSGLVTNKITQTGSTTNITIGAGTLYFNNGILTNSTGF